MIWNVQDQITFDKIIVDDWTKLNYSNTKIAINFDDLLY